MGVRVYTHTHTSVYVCVCVSPSIFRNCSRHLLTGVPWDASWVTVGTFLPRSNTMCLQSYYNTEWEIPRTWRFNLTLLGTLVGGSALNWRQGVPSFGQTWISFSSTTDFPTYVPDSLVSETVMTRVTRTVSVDKDAVLYLINGFLQPLKNWSLFTERVETRVHREKW